MCFSTCTHLAISQSYGCDLTLWLWQTPQEVAPKSTVVLMPHSFFYDLGNNYAGVARVQLPIGQYNAGATMTVVCTEYAAIARQPKGPADLYNQQDLYIFSGKEAAGDTWAPRSVYS